MKTSQGSVNTNQGTYQDLTLPGGEYGFYPRFKSTQTGLYIAAILADSLSSNVYITSIAIKDRSQTSKYIYAQQRYVTASGEVHWIFILRDKTTKKAISMYQAPDHPCFGNGGKPLLVPHPFGDYDKTKYEIIVINPTNEEIEQMELVTVIEDETKPDRDLLEVIMEDYEIDENSNPAWPDIPVTVGLPKHIKDKKTGKKVLADYR